MELCLHDGLFGAGIFDSSFTFAGLSVTQPRTVHCFELEFFSEDGGVTYLNGEAHPIRAGSVLCARPGDVRYSELPLRAHYLKIRAESEELCARLRALPRFFAAPIEPLIAHVRAILEAQAADNILLAQARFLELLAQLFATQGRAAQLQRLPQQKNRAAVSRGLAFIEAHFRERCTLADIAAHVHFSPVYFHGLFCTAIGKSPYEYLMHLRIEEAKRMLMDTQYTMSEIAAQCGFCSQSYFNYAFRRQQGTTPRAWRRQMLGRYFARDGRFE